MHCLHHHVGLGTTVVPGDRRIMQDEGWRMKSNLVQAYHEGVHKAVQLSKPGLKKQGRL